MEEEQQWRLKPSPLPLGMDWSFPPCTWNGRDTVWPNDFRTGWSYCITIPSWIAVTQARGMNSVVFYRVQVGLQSPEGVTTTHTVLRNFNDFLSLDADLRKAFPENNFPPTPPKHVTRNWAVADKRRRSLEDWMTSLLYDIDKSRSMAVVSFFELETAARSSFQDENPQTVEGHISKTGSEYLSLDKDLAYSLQKLPKYGVSNSGKGLYTGPAKLKQVVEYSGDTSHAQEIYKATRVNVQSGKSIVNSEKQLNGSFRKLSSDDGLILQGEEASSDKRLGLPLDEQQKVNRVFMSMQRNLRTSKWDMEDLIFRFNQQVAEKNYLTAKVKDLQEELETTKQRSKENLQQAILVERERVTQMQWDMDKLEHKSLESEFKLQPQQFDKTETESPNLSMILIQEKDELLQELDTTKNKLNDLLKQHRELEMNSKADIKVLVQEVKALRSLQSNTEQQLKHSLEGKTDTEKLLQQEKQKSEKEKADRLKFIREFEALHHRLRECSMNMLNETQDKVFHDSSSVQALRISDDQIEALLAEAHILSQNDNHEVSDISQTEDGGTTSDHELKDMLSKILVDNITLQKQLSSVFHYALKTSNLTWKDDAKIPAENESLNMR